jgi:hypothetical protein
MKNKTAQKKAWKFFFLNGKPHMLLSINWGRDEALAWSFDDKQRKLYQWSEVRRRGSRGFTMTQVSDMVKRTRMQIERYLNAGLVERPPLVTYPTSDYKIRLFSEEQIFKIRDIVASQHHGRPRKDGIIRSNRVPTREEIHAKIKYNADLYIRTEDGRFVRLYEAEDW